MRLFILIFLLAFCAACSSSPNTSSGNNAKTNTNAKPQSGPVPVYTYEVVNTYPHDPKAFTEGLFFHDGFLYESTGQEKLSSLRKVELATGKVVQKFDLPKEDFGEGIAMVNDQIYQLTWRQGLCRVFDANNFRLLRELNYQGDGWGMTTDGQNLYMTNSTHVIRVMDPQNFKQVRTISVFREDGRPLMQVNELEWIKGEIWSNVWHSEDPEILGKPNYIARIDPASGKLLGWIDLANISPDDQPKNPSDTGDDKAENTLNGIAYDAAGDRIFVTGKNWKKLYEIRVKPKS